MLQKCVLVASQHIRTATTTIEAIWPGTGNDKPAGYIGDVYLHGIFTANMERRLRLLFAPLCD